MNKLRERSGQATKMSLEAGPYMFHYAIVSGIIFLTLTDKGYPKKLAFQYLDELSNEFSRLYLGQIDQATKPYQFIKFGERRWGGATRLPQSLLGLISPTLHSQTRSSRRLGSSTWTLGRRGTYSC